MLRVQDTHLENKRYFRAHSFRINDLLALYLNFLNERRKVLDDKQPNLFQMQKRAGPYVMREDTVYVKKKTRQTKDRK